jgi:hypothetical protein
MGEQLCYVLPTEEVSLSEQSQRRQAAVLAGKQRAAEKWKVSIADLTARDANYATDFIAPSAFPVIAGVGGWLSMPFLVVGAPYSVFANGTPAAIAPVCPTNQLWVFYKVSVLNVAALDEAGILQFRTGAQANLKYQFDLENLYGKMVSDGYFSFPVTYENPEIATVTVTARVATLAGCRVKLGTFIIETMQSTLT